MEITEEIKKSVENETLTLTVNGETLLPNNQSFKESGPQKICSNGQIVKGDVCGKYNRN